jgi:cell pole-organizing protein PopZ
MEEILASIRRILAEDQGVVPVMRPRLAEDVLDLTEAIGEDGMIRHIPPTGRTAAPVRLAELPVADGRIEPVPPRRQEGEAPASADATRAVDAFARLAGAPRPPSRDADGGLEEVVRDMLRPLLRAWLDENLPALVERLVQAEIARGVDDAARR